MTNEEKARAALDRLAGEHLLTGEELAAYEALVWALDEIEQLRDDLSERDSTIEGYGVLIAETTGEIDQLMWELDFEREARL